MENKRQFNNQFPNQQLEDPKQKIGEIMKKFNSSWIKNEADRDLVTFAENAGKFMKEQKLSTSQIRNVYGEVKRIQVAGYEKDKTSFYLLKPKMAYALGRNNNNGLRLFKRIFDECYNEVKDEKTYKNFCNLIEALIAYHKSFGGK